VQAVEPGGELPRVAGGQQYGHLVGTHVVQARLPEAPVGEMFQQAGRYLTDHVIAAAAAEEVIDLPEGVDVQQYQRSGIVSVQVLQQPLPVGQPGQRVGVQAAE